MRPLVPFSESGLKVVDIDLDRPAHTRWVPAAKELGDEIHGVHQDLVEILEEQLGGRRRLRRFLTGTMGTVIGIVGRFCGQEYVDEIKSIAQTAELPTADLMLGNLAYDVMQFLHSRAPAACSTFSCNLPDGTPILGRNMDWEIPPSTGKFTVLYRLHRGNRHYYSLGVAGLVGVVTAWYPGHWAIALNQAPAEVLGTSLHHVPVTHHLRQVCDRFGSYSNLVSGVQGSRSMSPFFAHCVGIRSHQHTVINGLGAEYWTRDIDGPRLVQTNRFLLPELHKYNGPTEWEEDDGQRYYDTSGERATALRNRLRRLPTSVGEAQAKLRGGPVTVPQTVHSISVSPAHEEEVVFVRP